MIITDWQQLPVYFIDKNIKKIYNIYIENKKIGVRKYENNIK